MTPHAQDTGLWIDWIKNACGYPAVYLDIGAGDGFDCGVVKDAFPICHCIAIEPYEAWEVDDRVQKCRDVIAAENNYRVFYIKPNPGIHGLYSRLALHDREVQALHVRTLQHFCEREGIERIDAMKIDVEGAAWDVLAGAGDLLNTVKAVHVETEWIELFEHQRLEVEAFRLLEHAGLTMVHQHRVEELGQGDSIWVRQ